jgi:hypothetical protein
MLKKVSLFAGFAAGYVLGSKAGRERYEQIRDKANELMGNPTVQEKMHQATDTVQSQTERLTGAAKEKADEKLGDSGSPSSGAGGTSAGGTSAGGTSGTAGPRTSMGTSPASPAETSAGLGGSPKKGADGQRSTTGTDTGSGPVH